MQSKINPLFDHLIWWIGYPLMMDMNGKKSELDCVAITCLNSPFVSKDTTELEIVIKTPDETFYLYLENDKTISCKDVVEYLNNFLQQSFNDDLPDLKVSEIFFKDDKCYFLIGIEKYHHIKRTQSYTSDEFQSIMQDIYDSDDDLYIL